MSMIDSSNNRGSIPDLSNYLTTDERASANLIPPEQIGREDAETLAGAGILLGGSRSGTMVVRDHQPVCMTYDRDKFEMLPISAALERYDWLREKYYFKAIPADYDEAVASCAVQKRPLGFFIHVKKGADVTLPCQAAMYMASENVAQLVHNVVVLEDDSHLELITGCMTHHSVNMGLHLAVEEHYIGKNARFVSTMIHSWGSEVMVYPRTGTIVEENGRYESNYISLRAAKQVMSDPQTYLNGKGASAKYLTVVLGAPGSVINTQGKVYLNAEDTSAELAHRGVCTGGAMYQGGLLIGNAPCKAHVDCAGMLLDNTGEGFIESVPGLRSHHPDARMSHEASIGKIAPEQIESVPGLRSHHPDARMSHEASIGKIAPEQVEYLMSRGMDEREAISLLIRGFLGAEIEGLGAELDAQIAEIAEIAGHGEE